jgi:hypothetical protein
MGSVLLLEGRWKVWREADVRVWARTWRDHLSQVVEKAGQLEPVRKARFAYALRSLVEVNQIREAHVGVGDTAADVDVARG